MLRLLLFGGLSLLDGTAPLSGPATQRRRLALLARLAASPNASASRDKLIGCFWPDEDRERARHHLADSVFTLRKSLGKDTVLTVGDDLILNGEAVSCDVWQFHAALEGGDPEAAVDLYRGAFLDGFFVGDAPEFERWVEEERARLARLYAGGLETLALAREGDGELAHAVQWWKRLAAHDPSSSRVALRLMQALARAGERAAALQHAKIHAALLREEYDLPPDPLIEALAAELASAPPPPTPAAAAPLAERMLAPAPPPTSAGARREELEPAEALAPPAPPAAAAVAPGISPPTPHPPSTRRRRRRFRRRNAVVAFSLLLPTLLVAAVMWSREWLPPSWLLPPVEAAPSEVITIAVMPFDYRGSADYAFYGTGIVTLLGISLDGAGGIRTADTNAILSRASDAADSTPLSLDAATEIAAALEADYFLGGSLVESDGRFEMVVSLYPAEPDPVAAWTESATGTEVSTLVYEIARLLLVEQLDAPADRLTRMAMLTNAPLPALKAYFQGEQELRAARYERAAEYLQEAVREDPSFALAYYRLSMAEEWRFRFPEARSAAEEARTLGERQEPGTQRLIAAWDRFVHGDPEIAERLYHAVLTEDPFDVEALSGLGEVQVHFNPVRGRPIDEAVPNLRTVLELAPDVGEARFHLMEFAARAGNRAEFDSLLAGVDPQSPHLLAWQAARAAAWP
ncbi:MAG TPA: BTAD domain-containing putative transcriptional regulator, partial [Longimicrobiaceae bacterium]